MLNVIDIEGHPFNTSFGGMGKEEEILWSLEKKGYIAWEDYKEEAENEYAKTITPDGPVQMPTVLSYPD